MLMRRFFSGLIYAGWLLASPSVQALPVSGVVSLGDTQSGIQGVAYILEDTADNRLMIERMAKAIDHTSGLRRRLQSRTTQQLNREHLREMNQAQARLQGQTNRMVAMAINRAQLTVPIADGEFTADVPFERQLVVAIAQSEQRIGWWLQATTAALPFALNQENSLLTRSLITAQPREPVEEK